MINTKYLSGRPFLVISFSQQPRAKVNTKVKGWMNNPANLKTLEHVSIVDRIGNKQMAASVVIDVIDGIAVRNQTAKTDEEVISHYIGRYAEKIKEALGKWAQDQVIKGMVEQPAEVIDG